MHGKLCSPSNSPMYSSIWIASTAFGFPCLKSKTDREVQCSLSPDSGPQTMSCIGVGSHSPALPGQGGYFIVPSITESNTQSQLSSEPDQKIQTTVESIQQPVGWVTKPAISSICYQPVVHPLSLFSELEQLPCPKIDHGSRLPLPKDITQKPKLSWVVRTAASKANL